MPSTALCTWRTPSRGSCVNSFKSVNVRESKNYISHYETRRECPLPMGKLGGNHDYGDCSIDELGIPQFTVECLPSLGQRSPIRFEHWISLASESRLQIKLRTID